MEGQSKQWTQWCRLCAKDDVDNLSYEASSLQLPDDIKITLSDVLAKYFWIELQDDNIPARSLCMDCHSFLEFIIKFSDRVQRVQQMYQFLVQTSIGDVCDLASVRLKFNVFDENACVYQRNTPYLMPGYTSIKSPCHSEYDSKADLPVKLELSSVPEEMTYDEECLPKGIHEDDEDSFQYQQDPFQCETNSETEAKSESTKNTSQLFRAKNVKLSLRKKKRRTGVESKKKPTEDSKVNSEKSSSKDFPLEVSCLECALDFNLYSAYYKHLKLQHGSAVKENSWKCPSCESTLHTRDSFKRHMMLHVPAHHLSIQCTQCDKRYRTKAQLELHAKQSHCNERRFICEECGFGFTTLGNLKQHITTHSDQTPFECEKCKKKFKTVTQLKRHLDTHGPSKHVCTICKQELNSRITLKRHYLVHSDVMQHKCDYCGRAFKRSKTLKTHLLLHTGLKPYSCDFCDRTFANGSNCRSHMKKMHPVELSALEASGGRAHTKNIPKLENLKALTK